MEKSKKNVPKIRFKGFEKPWEEKILGEIADIVGGGTPATYIREYWDGDIDWYSPAEIGNKVFAEGSQRKITELGLKNSSAKILPAGTVLFSSRAGIGSTAILTREGATNQGFQSIIPHKNILDSYFIFSRTRELKRYGEINGAGSTFIEISGKQMANMPLVGPEITEQIIIGNYFQQIDKLIETSQRKLDKLKNIKKACLEKMFPKKGTTIPEIRFKGFTEEWAEKTLREIASLITKGTTPLDKSGNGTINFVKIENINSSSGKIVITNRITKEEHEGYLKRSQLQVDDILFSIAGTLGRIAVVNKEIIPANTNQALAIIRLHQGDISYIITYLKGVAVNDFVRINPTIGAQPNLSLEQMGNLEISFPHNQEQHKIGSFFKNLDNLIFQNEQQLTKLKNIKKACLEKMFVNTEDTL